MGLLLASINLIKGLLLFYIVGQDLFLIYGTIEIYNHSLKFVRSGVALQLERDFNKNDLIPTGLFFNDLIFYLISIPILLMFFPELKWWMLLILLVYKSSNLASTIFMYRNGVFKYYTLEIIKSISGLVLALSLFYYNIFNLSTYLFSILFVSIFSLILLKKSDLKIIFKLRAIEFIETGYLNLYNLYRVSLFLGIGSVFAVLYPFFDKLNNLINAQFSFYFNKFKRTSDLKILKVLSSYIFILIFLFVFLILLLNSYDLSFIFSYFKFPYDTETIILFCVLIVYTPITIVSNFLSLTKNKKFFNLVQVSQIILFCSISVFSLLYAYFFTIIFNLCIYFYLYYQKHLES